MISPCSAIRTLDVPVHQITRREAATFFVSLCDEKGTYFTATPNAEILLEARENEDLKQYLQQCVLNVPDSVSLLWAGECLNQKWGKMRSILELLALPVRKRFWTAFPEQVCGSDLFWDICAEAEKKERSLFLLGGEGTVAKETLKFVQKMYPKLKVVGAAAGSPLAQDDDLVVAEINRVKPDIIFVAYGCPKQELWIARNLKKCETASVAMGIGGTFDFVVGKVKRAPKMFRMVGLEWLWRLIMEPRRWKRIWRAVWVFPKTVILVSFGE